MDRGPLEFTVAQGRGGHGLDSPDWRWEKWSEEKVNQAGLEMRKGEGKTGAQVSTKSPNSRSISILPPPPSDTALRGG